MITTNTRVTGNNTTYQQRKLPPLETPHENALRTDSALTEVKAARSLSGGVSDDVVLPEPSWPMRPSPQHLTPFEIVNTHVCAVPAETCSTPEITTVDGGDITLATPPLPSWPLPRTHRHRHTHIQQRDAITWRACILIGFTNVMTKYTHTDICAYLLPRPQHFTSVVFSSTHT